MKLIQVRFGLSSVLFAALLSFSSVGRAAIVNNCDEASLRSALAEGGTVTFACDGTIVLTNTIVVDATASIDASGHKVTLSGGNSVRIFDVLSNATLALNQLTLANGQGRGSDGTTMQPGTPGQGGAVRVQGGTLCAVNCTFATNTAVGGKGGNAPTNFTGSPLAGALGEGGAIYAAFAVLNLTNCVFDRNASGGGAGGDVAPGDTFAFGGDGGPSRGGSIRALSSQIILAGGLFANNAANPGGSGAGRWTGNRVATWGGALYAENGTCVGAGLTWRGNGARAAGGGCYLQAGEAAFASCLFDGNGAADTSQTSGGAIRSQSTRLGLVDCLLRNNTAAGMEAFLIRGFGQYGGFAEGGAVAAAGGELGVTNCTFAGNLAQGGDGAFVGPPLFVLPSGSAEGGGLAHSGIGVVINCTFAGNVARSGRASGFDASGGRGGALASGGSLIIRFSTIASNSVIDNITITTNSQGAGCYAGGSPFLLASSIIVGNFATTGGRSGVPANASGPITDGGYNLSSDASPGFTEESSLNDTDPLLRPLADNGGRTPTMALVPASPAVNAGDAASCPPTDQRGVSRPQLGGCDIGAFELPYAFQILAFQRAGPDDYLLSGLGIPNRSFRVEATESLKNWVEVASGVVDSQGRFVVEVDAGLQLQRFYRIAAP